MQLSSFLELSFGQILPGIRKLLRADRCALIQEDEMTDRYNISRGITQTQGYGFPAVSRRTDHDRNPKKTDTRDAAPWLHLQAYCRQPFTAGRNSEVLLPPFRKKRLALLYPTAGKPIMQTMWEENHPGGKTQEKDLLLQGMLSEVVELPPISGKPIFKIPIPLHLPCMWQILHRLWQ